MQEAKNRGKGKQTSTVPHIDRISETPKPLKRHLIVRRNYTN